MGSKAAKFVRLRLKGMGQNEAARAAGWPSGRPSEHARTLYRDALRVRGHEAVAADWIDRQIDECERRLTALRAKRRAVDLCEALG